ncbi:uncharacterized protein DUF4123 [Cricetibacter osteomyelitidis]|uniref:Uncharacterized protein DUF4123 n=1 Tax=Cricetibacter osteomyelitidis TaxID=1521931 RepID=A0A4R2T2S4_9PAST|nr:DUF4123 domain-containing protein [Cricetibacter osteomyelitidis]TCP96530.1 uncharacterized protein DUF4123 [Cricetibacter osteomyelitidis]
MNELNIWVNHYHYSSADLPNVVSTGYIACRAESAETYYQQVAAYCKAQGLEAYAQLAPLPILTWFERHGFSSQLLYLAKTLSAQNPVGLLSDGEPKADSSPPLQPYLTQSETDFEPFLDIFSDDALPHPVRHGFFAHCTGLDEWHKWTDLSGAEQGETHYYAVADCAKVVGLSDRLEQVGRTANLYSGAVGASLEENAPYLLEFDPKRLACVDMLQTLFRDMDSEVLSYWQANPMIFIRSRADFDSVYRHLKKFTHLQEPETKKWYFFRFYDPQVLNGYLPLLTNHPAHLAALFGVKNGEQMIEAFGVRIDKRFITFGLEALPEDIVPARIEFGEIEQNAIRSIITEKFRRKLTALYVNSHPDRFRTLKDKHITAFVEHVYQSALAYKITRPEEIGYFGHLMLYLGAYWHEDPIYHFLNQHLHEDTDIADRRMDNIAHKFTQTAPKIFGNGFENNIKMAKDIADWYQLQSKESLSPTAVMHYLAKVSQPYFGDYVKQPEYLEHIRQSLQYASKKHGIKTDYEQAIWLLMSLTLGIGFYHDPLMPWAGDILNSHQDSTEKMDELIGMLQKRTNKMLSAAFSAKGETHV